MYIENIMFYIGYICREYKLIIYVYVKYILDNMYIWKCRKKGDKYM